MFLQKAHAPMFFMAGDGSSLHQSEGDYNLGRFEYRHTSSAGATSVFVLKWYSTPWTSDVVLNFLFLCMVSREAPRLHSSEGW
jgi:hypothetical protein